MTEQIHISRRDVLWTYASLGLGAGINVLLLPLLLTFLTAAELGLWYVFAAVGTLTVVLDFGLMTTVSRNVTMAWMGAPQLDRTSSDIGSAQGAPNYDLLGRLLGACRSAYLALGATVLALCLTVGTVHVENTSDGQIARSDALTAWAIFSVAVAANMALSFWNPLLRGLGRVSESAKANVAAKVAQLVLTPIALVGGGGLAGVAGAYLLSGIVFRAVSRRYFFRAVRAQADAHLPTHGLRARLEVLRIIWPNSYRQGIVSVSQYVMASAPVLIGSMALPLPVVASLGITLQLIGLVKVVANAPFNAFLPEFTSLRMNGATDRLGRRFTLAVGIATYSILLGGAGLLLAGNRALIFVGSDVTLLASATASALLLHEWALNQTALCSAFLATDNRVPMAKAYAVTVILSVALQAYLVVVLDLGVWGLVLGGVTVALAYNTWVWPRRAAKDIGQGGWKFLYRTFSVPALGLTRKTREA